MTTNDAMCWDGVNAPLFCDRTDPRSGAYCVEVAGHGGYHSGADSEGVWHSWLGK